MILNLVLWVAGAALLGFGVWRVRAPWSRLQQQRALDENAKRYDAWRGGSRTAAAPIGGGRTGADEMRDLLRSQVRIWSGVIAAGIVLIVLGFVIR